MAKIPDKAEHQRQFAGLAISDRRAIIRAVNRGQAVEERKLAPLAVGVARRQTRFWRVAWILGPLVGLTGLFTNSDLRLVLINVAVASAALGLMSWFWYSRARRAEQLNLELAQTRRERDRSQHATDDGPSTAQRFRSHLPGGGGASGASGTSGASGGGRTRTSGGSTAAGANGADHGRREPAIAPPPGQRPYKPRGRKRR